MKPAELRAVVEHLRNLVTVEQRSDGIVIAFAAPGEADLLAVTCERDGVRRLLGAPWWDEMTAEVMETPEFCDPGDSPEQVLAYARDVISEYVAKRFEP